MTIEQLKKKADLAEIDVLKTLDELNTANSTIRSAEAIAAIARNDYYEAYGRYIIAHSLYSEVRREYLEARNK